jgi:hypothetical protein
MSAKCPRSVGLFTLIEDGRFALIATGFAELLSDGVDSILVERPTNVELNRGHKMLNFVHKAAISVDVASIRLED